MAASCRRFLFALDFDGVLVDSAAETALSGFAAARRLWPGAPWLTRRLRRPDQMESLVDRFRAIRPCLETGWESSILLHLLTEGYTTADIMGRFQAGLRDETMEKLGVDQDACNAALKAARTEWIEEDGSGEDWLDAHGFYDGACDAVRALLDAGQGDDVYIITTKAADFAERLLQKQQLFGAGAVAGGIAPDHIFGLGSGPKQEVLARLLAERGDGASAIFVEDRLKTLEKTMGTPALQTCVVPVLAGWGYNTPEQQGSAEQQGMCVLGAAEPGRLAAVLQASEAERLLTAAVAAADTAASHSM